MGNRKRRALGTLVAALLLVGPVTTAGASGSTTTTTVPKAPAAAANALPAPAAAAILIDVDTGRALYEDNAHDPLPPGSLTKTLTAMIATDWLPATASIPVTPVAFNAYPDKVGMRPGQRWSLDITLHALITDSANDAAYALAVYIGGGSLAGFVPILRSAAAQIGLSDRPTLEDPAGLDFSEGFNGGNRISAWDLSIMGRDMMANPQLSAIALLQTYDFEGPDHIAYHLLSHNYHFLATYPGAIGVKTGYTDAAGACLIAEAVRDGRHMLAVILRSPNPDQDAEALLSDGFTVPVAGERGDPVLPPVAQPEPEPQTPPTTSPSRSSAASSGARARAAIVDSTRADHTRNTVLNIAAAAAGLLLLVGSILWFRRFRRLGRETGGRYQPTHASRPKRDS